MKIKLTLLLMMFGVLDLLGHGGHMATFKYDIASNNIILEFKIENSILHHFDLEEDCENYKTATAMCLVQYINKKTQLKMDGNKVIFELQSSQKGKDFFTIKMSAQGDFSSYQNLSIGNECFLEFDRKFENRIIVQKDDSIKSYRLNRKHKEITI